MAFKQSWATQKSRSLTVCDKCGVLGERMGKGAPPGRPSHRPHELCGTICAMARALLGSGSRHYQLGLPNELAVLTRRVCFRDHKSLPISERRYDDTFTYCALVKTCRDHAQMI